MTIGYAELSTAAGVLLGFSVTSFMWRIAQEAHVADRGDISWLPPADIVNLAGMIVIVVGVFLAPLASVFTPRLAAWAFGLGALLFVGHCFALAGHYELYNNRTSRSYQYFPVQERVVVIVLILVVIAYTVISAI